MLGKDGRIWSIDHGLTFNAIPRMRTVIWDYVQEELPADFTDGLERLLPHLDAPDGPLTELSAPLSPAEIESLKVRAAALLRRCSFPGLPEQAGYRPVPSPPVLR